MTGSNTNSNVVFGQLQQQTAVALELSVPLILAAQTAGGAIGSLASGYTWEGLGAAMTFTVGSGIALLGAVVAWRMIDRQHDF